MSTWINRPSTYRRLLLVSLATWILASGCTHQKKPSVATYPWFSSLRENIVTTVPDTTRARRLLGLIDILELDVITVIEAAEPLREQLMAMNADYDTPREDFVAVRGKMNANSMAARRKLAAFRLEMKSLLTAKQWEQIMHKQETLFEMAVHQYLVRRSHDHHRFIFVPFQRWQ